jgi:hypothetical protein
MATVDIEPASLAVTPGESHVLTLTITNDDDDVEAYHVAAVDDAAAYVTIAPDTLLVRAGETASATATLTLENTGKWPVGDMIVRFRVVPAGRPDAFLVVEAIAAIQSFSDVAAVLTPDAVEAFRSATAEVTIANAGNAYTYAEVSLSAGELALSINESHVALPADSAETVGVRVGARSLLWRGSPQQHPFVVTVSPEGGETISLDGTFTQRPLLPRWSRTAAIAIGAAAVLALVVWMAVRALGGVIGPPDAEESTTPTPTPSATPLPEPEVRVSVDAPGIEESHGGDPVSFALEPDVAGAPAGSRLGMKVEWPPELDLTDWDCEDWVAPENDRVLEGRPQPGDECVVRTSAVGSDAITLTFATPPEGLPEEELSVSETRLLMFDDDQATEVETGLGARFGDSDPVEFDLPSYPYWMEIEDSFPSANDGDVEVTIHRRDDSDPNARLTFEVGLPDFVTGISHSFNGCLDRVGTTCVVAFDSEAETERVVKFALDVKDGGGIGAMRVDGISLDGVSEDVSQQVRGDEGMLVSERMFAVDMRLETDEPQSGRETVTAIVEVSGVELPEESTDYRGGSWEQKLRFEWPEGLVPDSGPPNCDLIATEGLCTLHVAPGESERVELQFIVDDPAGEGAIGVRGAELSYDPTTDADVGDGRVRSPETRPAHWIGSTSCSLDGQCE